MTSGPDEVDVRRRAGWLPADQDELESWIAGHRERVETRGEQIVLHPVLHEFQELIDTDPVVRMYVSQMIAQVPSTKPYRTRHLVFRPGVVAEFTLSAIPQPHDPKAPLVLVRSKLATANATA